MFLQIPFLLRPQTVWVLWTLLTSPSLRTSQHPKQQATCSSSICQCILRCGACSISRKWCFSIPWPALQSSMVGWQMPWPRSIMCSPLTTEEWERAPVLQGETGQGIALFPESCYGSSQGMQKTLAAQPYPYISSIRHRFVKGQQLMDAHDNELPWSVLVATKPPI